MFNFVAGVLCEIELLDLEQWLQRISLPSNSSLRSTRLILARWSMWNLLWRTHCLLQKVWTRLACSLIYKFVSLYDTLMQVLSPPELKAFCYLYIIINWYHKCFSLAFLTFITFMTSFRCFGTLPNFFLHK